MQKHLRVNGNALIESYQVHNQLILDKKLFQKQFSGAICGNIINTEHLSEFLHMLSPTSDDTSISTTPPSSGKKGATLFFPGHAVSILKSTDRNTRKTYYEFIDPMPTYLCDGTEAPMGTCTLCANLNSLENIIMWYALRNFSNEDFTIFECNEWNDNNTDADPRVFQGYVCSATEHTSTPMPHICTVEEDNDDEEFYDCVVEEIYF
jgi:hypothetical protein